MNKAFAVEVAQIALPVALQSMLQSSFGMIDQVMVGQMGTQAVAAAALASRPVFLFSVITGAVTSGAGILIAQFLGQSEQRTAEQALTVHLMFLSAIAAVLTVVCCWFPGIILSLYTRDGSLPLLGAEYLRLISFTFVPNGITALLAVMLRCRGKAAYPLAASMLAAAVNTGLNALLIFGRCGFPAMGLTGAALASVISVLVNLLVTGVLYFRCGGRGSLPHGRKGLIKGSLTVLLPLLANEILWGIGQNVFTAVYGHLGTQELAAMSMTDPVQGLFIGAMSGMAQASGVLIGRRLGATRYEEAYDASKGILKMGVLGSVLLSLLLLTMRGAYVKLYATGSEVQGTAALLLGIFAVMGPIKVMNMILGGGIIRSGGNTKLTMAIDLMGTWLVGIPLAYLGAAVLHLPVGAVYLLLSQEETVRLLATLAVFRKRKWMKTIEA